MVGPPTPICSGPAAVGSKHRTDRLRQRALRGSILAAALLVSVAHGDPRLGKGPLYVRSQNPGQSFRITSLAHDARGLPADWYTLGISDTATNIWGESAGNNYLLDFQMNDAGLYLGHGVTPRLSLGLAVTERRIMNLHMDQAVLNVHDWLGISQDGRREVPKNDLRIRIGDYGLDLGFDELDNRLISLSAESFVTWQWIRGGNTGLSLANYVQLRHELSEQALVQEDSTDATLGLALTWPFNHANIIYFNAGYTRLGNAELVGIPIRQELANGMISWERRLSRYNSVYVQYLVNEQLAHDLGELSEPAHQIQFGWKWRQEAFTWQLALVENAVFFSNSPDVAINLALRYDFRTGDR